LTLAILDLSHCLGGGVKDKHADDVEKKHVDLLELLFGVRHVGVEVLDSAEGCFPLVFIEFKIAKDISHDRVLLLLQFEVRLMQIQSRFVLACHVDKRVIEMVGEELEVEVIRLLVQFSQVVRVQFFAHGLAQNDPLRKDLELLHVEPRREIHNFNEKNLFERLDAILQRLLLHLVSGADLVDYLRGSKPLLLLKE